MMSKGEGLFPYVMGQKVLEGQKMRHLFTVREDGKVEFLSKETKPKKL